jgi:hypothetical protein
MPFARERLDELLDRRARAQNGDESSPSRTELPARVTSDAVRRSIDAGDVDALRSALRENPALLTELVRAPDIEPTSLLTYVGMARF